jgi:hypothetical protein
MTRGLHAPECRGLFEVTGGQPSVCCRQLITQTPCSGCQQLAAELATCRLLLNYTRQVFVTLPIKWLGTLIDRWQHVATILFETSERFAVSVRSKCSNNHVRGFSVANIKS